ncbi:MAG: TolB family protein [Anaerolineales bacterium]
MKASKRVRGMRWLLVGMLAGLALALLVSLALDQNRGRRVPAARAKLSDRDPVSALGPIRLAWPTDVTALPSAAEFSIDSDIAVRLEAGDGNLLLVPASPLTPGAHRLRYQSEGEEPAAWDFEVRPPEPLFLRGAELGQQLYRWGDGDPELLSGEHSVRDYAPAPQGEVIAYASENDQSGTDLWVVSRDGEDRRLLLGCGSDICGELDWTPDGARLAFSRKPDRASDDPRLWTVDREGKSAAPLYQDEDRLGRDPTWSPDGRWLVYYDPTVNGVRVLDSDTVAEQVIPSRAGVSGAWAYREAKLYLPLLVFREEEPVTHLYRVDPVAQTLAQVLGDSGGWRQVGEPALGLAGEWLAFAGQRGSAAAPLGLWLMHLDSEEVQPLVQREGFSYGGPSWDATGQHLLFQRFPQGEIQGSPDVMLWSAGQAEPELLIENAALADWLP